jgi:hypothetical protein
MKASADLVKDLNAVKLEEEDLCMAITAASNAYENGECHMMMDIITTMQLFVTNPDKGKAVVYRLQALGLITEEGESGRKSGMKIGDIQCLKVEKQWMSPILRFSINAPKPIPACPWRPSCRQPSLSRILPVSSWLASRFLCPNLPMRSNES